MITRKELSNAPLVPALRARMGDRWYYVGTMMVGDVVKHIQPASHLEEQIHSMRATQRRFQSHAGKELSRHLRLNADRFLSAIVVGIYGGEPEWLPVDIDGGLPSGDVQEVLFPIDGRQRLEGLRDAVRAKPSLRTDEQAVIFVAHSLDANGSRRTKRLFLALHAEHSPTARRSRPSRPIQ